MSQIFPLSRERHALKRWDQTLGYTKFAHAITIPVLTFELPRLITSCPIAFAKNNDSFSMVALLGIDNEKNLFIGKNGKWLGTNIPSLLQAYPFKLLSTDSNQLVLCIDEDSEALSDTVGEMLFDDTGSLSETVTKHLELLKQIHSSEKQTAQVCTILSEHSILKSWPIQIQSTGGNKQIEGLYQIDEQALNKLDDEAFLKLRHNGALITAYCQMLSMQQLGTLSKMAQMRQEHQSHLLNQTPPATISLENDMFCF